jgi:hypothetical protein
MTRVCDFVQFENFRSTLMPKTQKAFQKVLVNIGIQNP